MKRKLCFLLLLAFITVLAATLCDPNRILLGLIQGEAFFQGRPSSYWEQVLRADGISGELQNATIQTFRGKLSAVPVIKKCLENPDRNVRWAAARILPFCALFGQQSVAFTKLLGDADRLVRLEAIIGLGNLRREAIHALPQLEPLANHDDLQLSTAARFALWNIDKATAIRAEKWQDYEDSEWGFAARFPGSVEKNSRPLPTAESYLYTYSVSVGSTHFEVGVTVFTTDPAGSIEEIYDLACTTGIKALKGTNEQRKNISLGTHIGREHAFTAEDGLEMHSRYFIVGRCSYQTVVAYSPGLIHPDTVDYFFSSFRILPR